MGQKTINFTTKGNKYEDLKSEISNLEHVNPPPPDGLLHFDNPSLNIISCPPKGSLQNTTHNPIVRATHSSNIIEELAQNLAVMSTLEVLQSFLTQHKTFLSTIGLVDPSYLNIMTLYPTL